MGDYPARLRAFLSQLPGWDGEGTLTLSPTWKPLGDTVVNAPAASATNLLGIRNGSCF